MLDDPKNQKWLISLFLEDSPSRGPGIGLDTGYDTCLSDDILMIKSYC